MPSAVPEYRPRPIFIIGAPRSGTSITTWVLGQHPNIQTMPETAWIASMAVGSYLSFVRGSERDKFSHLSNVEYALEPFMEHIGLAVDSIVHDVFDKRCSSFYGEQFRREGWELGGKQLDNPLQLRRSAGDPKRRWVDGTPLNSHYVWPLGLMFPEALFIHNLRRPDEVATSLEGFAKVGAEPQELEQGLETWISHAENAWHVERAYGSDRVYRLDFARIGSEPERLFREVCDFLGEEFDANCLLPLRRELNSSDVTEKRKHNLDLLRGNDTFKRAAHIHELIAGHDLSRKPDQSSLEVLRQRFLDYCLDRPLI